MLKLGYWVMIVGFISLTAAIVLRGFEAVRFPLANLYESLLWFAWATMGGYLFLCHSYGVKQLGWLASLTAATMFLYGSWLPASQHEIAPLVPALVSYWRQIHVPPLIVSYAMFFLAGLASLLQLWFAGRRLSLIYAVATIVTAGAAIALGTYTAIESHWLQIMFVCGSIAGIILAWQNLPSVQVDLRNAQLASLYDEVCQRTIAIGLPLLTIGIITGGLWANHAWGSYWSWDPKESMALVTLLVYAAYLHLRIHREVSAEKLAVLAVGGLLLVLLTYLGFNSLGFGGLHSYGRFR
jgi:cytochrome c-type biogenesis protein CcsB